MTSCHSDLSMCTVPGFISKDVAMPGHWSLISWNHPSSQPSVWFPDVVFVRSINLPLMSLAVLILPSLSMMLECESLLAFPVSTVLYGNQRIGKMLGVIHT